MSKRIIITGGVCSSLGKGISAASLGSLLECHNYNIQMIKIDPYINVDAGTMSPYQHGEVFVTPDGTETDLDLGNYSRYTHAQLGRSNSITTGQIYQEVIQRERQGRYLGRTVQMIPHITDHIKERIYAVESEEGIDVTIVEIGGTVGDIESVPYLEAARQMMRESKRENVLSIHLTLIPMLGTGEQKTKPTQHSVRELREIGVQADMLICRSAEPVTQEVRNKIALFSNVSKEAVFFSHNVLNPCEVPSLFREQGLDTYILDRLQLPPYENFSLERWKKVVHVVRHAKLKIRIGLVGKYTDLSDSYKSIDEALMHGGVANQCRVETKKINSELLSQSDTILEDIMEDIDGILVPGGFGIRGVEGMIMAAQYARTCGIPYLGICEGMQIMVIEYARSVMGLINANSTEFDPECDHPVIVLQSEQEGLSNYGGTMRLGNSQSMLAETSLIRTIYKKATITECHRHRYEVANTMREAFTKMGLHITGTTLDEELVESIEWPHHPWGIGVQFHPEFNTKPWKAHPLFTSFIAAAQTHMEKGGKGVISRQKEAISHQ